MTSIYVPALREPCANTYDWMKWIYLEFVTALK